MSPSHPDRLDISYLTSRKQSPSSRKSGKTELHKTCENFLSTRKSQKVNALWKDNNKSLQVSRVLHFNKRSNLYQLVEAGVFPMS